MHINDLVAATLFLFDSFLMDLMCTICGHWQHLRPTLGPSVCINVFHFAYDNKTFLYRIYYTYVESQAKVFLLAKYSHLKIVLHVLGLNANAAQAIKGRKQYIKEWILSCGTRAHLSVFNKLNWIISGGEKLDIYGLINGRKMVSPYCRETELRLKRRKN